MDLQQCPWDILPSTACPPVEPTPSSLLHDTAFWTSKSHGQEQKGSTPDGGLGLLLNLHRKGAKVRGKGAHILVPCDEPGGPPLQLLSSPACGVDDVAVGLTQLPHLIEVQALPVAPVVLGEQLLKLLWHKATLCVVHLAVRPCTAAVSVPHQAREHRRLQELNMILPRGCCPILSVECRNAYQGSLFHDFAGTWKQLLGTCRRPTTSIEHQCSVDW